MFVLFLSPCGHGCDVIVFSTHFFIHEIINVHIQLKSALFSREMLEKKIYYYFLVKNVREVNILLVFSQEMLEK